MVDPTTIERLEKQVRALRGTVVRVPGPMNDRIDHLLLETRRLQTQAETPDSKGTLRSIENLLGAVREGLNQHTPPPRRHVIAAA